MMKSSSKGNLFSLSLLAVLIAVFPAAAQYAGTPGDIPPLPDSYQLDVGITQPCSSAFIIPGITDEDAQRMENPGEDEIIYRCDGVTIACLEYLDRRFDLAYVFKGEWGLNCEVFDNAVCISQLSPSGRYYAVGGDGTGTNRGSVYVFDLETGVKYCTTTSSILGCSDWVEGDYLLIECAGGSESALDMWRQGDIKNIPWLNTNYMTERQGSSSDFVLYHGGSSWMILPEDRFYNYSARGIPGSFENGIFFDVMAETNVIPSLAGIEQRSDFSEWVDSVGYDNAFPNSYFRIYVDTRANSVSNIREIDPGMVVEGYLNAMKGGNFNRMQEYLTRSHRSFITDEQREEMGSILWHMLNLEYRIHEISEDGDRADVTCELTLFGFSYEGRFVLVKEYDEWLIDDVSFDYSN